MLDDELDPWDVDEEVYNAIRMAELAAEGVALRASARAALLHRAALALLGASLLLGIAMLVLPILRPWHGEAVWVFALGFGCYALVVAIAYWSRPVPSAPEMRELLDLRHRMAALYAELRRAPGSRANPVLLGILADAVRQLDEQLVPALRELLDRRAQLRRELRRYERGQIRAPEPAMLDRLRRMLKRIDVAVDTCLQQAANAYATLIALLQIRNDDDVTRRAGEWADGLTTLYDAMVEVLRGTDEAQQVDEPPGQASSDDAPAAGEGAVASLSGSGDVVRERNGSTTQRDVQASTEASVGSPDVSVDANDEQELSVEMLATHVEDALRRVRDRGALDGCALMEYLPWTIVATLQHRGVRSVDATPLEQAAALQRMLIAAVDRLKSDAADAALGESATVYYQILRGQYFEGRSVRQMMTRLSVAEATYHRYRRRAIRVLTRELIEQEALARRNGLDGQASA